MPYLSRGLSGGVVRGLAATLSLSTALLGASPAAWAGPAQGLIATDEVAAALSGASAGHERLARELDRPELQARLQAHGVSAEQARERIAALTDQEAAALVGQIDAAPAGGDVLGTVVFIFVLLLVTDILGFTRIFPFTRSIR